MPIGIKGFRKSYHPKTEFKKGKLHPLWKDGKVGYKSLHEWIGVNWGKAKEFICTHCIKRALDWANVNGIYNRERENWMPLCRSCHKKFDKADTSVARAALAEKRRKQKYR